MSRLERRLEDAFGRHPRWWWLATAAVTGAVPPLGALILLAAHLEAQHDDTEEGDT